MCSKLLAWYSFQSSKSDESTYYASCVDVLREDRCFRFESALGTTENQPGYFTTQYLDTGINPPAFIDFSVDKQERWSRYVDEFLHANTVHVDPRKNKVYLQRFVCLQIYKIYKNF